MARSNKRNQAIAKAANESVLKPEVAGIEVKTSQTIRQYAGPIPAPETLRDYEQIHSGLAERLIRMAEQESEHRHGIETKVIDAQVKDVPALRASPRPGLEPMLKL